MTFTELAIRLCRLPGPLRVIAIDGHGGAGKTSFANRLMRATPNTAESLEIVLLHTDEFARPDQPVEWWPRLGAVIDALRRNESATFRPYDWPTRTLLGPRIVRPPDLLMIEGVSSSRQEWSDAVDFAIWIETDALTCQRRGMARDHVTAEAWDRAAKEEHDFFVADNARSRADLIVDGGAVVADPDRDFVALERWAPHQGAASASTSIQ